MGVKCRQSLPRPPGPEAETYELVSMSRNGSTCWLVVHSCVANHERACLLTQLLTMTTTHKFPVQGLEGVVETAGTSHPQCIANCVNMASEHFFLWGHMASEHFSIGGGVLISLFHIEPISIYNFQLAQSDTYLPNWILLIHQLLVIFHLLILTLERPLINFWFKLLQISFGELIPDQNFQNKIYSKLSITYTVYTVYYTPL